ncbi:MAG: SPASM domain-containing protein [Thermotogae bacterium]|jgi:uncharacterized protein|nr:SPASM domain-containing protein [Thermotogota bacterium]MCL5032092.1 SPASM domain-containing protein [Thermotogota bacterium]
MEIDIMKKKLKLCEMTYLYPNYDKGQHLVVSNLTGTTVLVDDKMLDILLRLKEMPLSLSDLSAENRKRDIEKLYESRIVIDIDQDGFKLMKEHIEKIKLRDELDVMPVVTTQCNLACPYCFEEKTDEYMDYNTIKQTVNHVVQRIEKENIHHLYVGLFGGEPLLNEDGCREFMIEMNEAAIKHNVETKFALITNGTLITKSFVDFMSRFDSFFVQITIDGPAEVNDKRRIFKNGNGTYDILINNMIFLSKYVTKLIIRINVDDNNINSIPLLVTNLKKAGLDKENVFIDLERVMSNTPKNSFYSAQCISSDNYNEAILPYVLEFRKNGFKTLFRERNKIRPIYCWAYTGKHIAITPNGDIYTCLDGIGDKRFVVGNVWNDPPYNEKFNEWKEFNPMSFKKCANCSIVGFCGGGCGAEAMAKYGSLKKETVCSQDKKTYIGGSVLPSALRKIFLQK